MATTAEEIRQQIIDLGGSFRANELIDLATVCRAKMGWVSENIQQGLGVPAKPFNAVCPICGHLKQEFQLDHMGPWRTYVAALSGNSAHGGHITIGPNGEYFIPRDIAKALYNDPANLWWICRDCNGSKSDHAYDQATISPANLTHGPKGVKVSDVF